MMKNIFLIVILFLTLYACTRHNGEETTVLDCSGPAKSFAADVSPIIQRTCNDDAGCHGLGSTNGPGPLLSYQQIFNARTNIHAAVSSGRMPLNSRLTSAERSAILCWIDNGAPNN